MQIKERQTSLDRIAFVICAVLFLEFQPAAFAGSPPLLSNPTWTGSQFQFVLNGQTNVSYIIESSADLSAWTPVLTNADPQATRFVTLPASSSSGFWRVSRVPGPLFVNAIAARGAIILGGSGPIDTFNSALPGIESDLNGRYQAVLATDRAKIVTTSNSAGVINVGNMSVYGSIATGPGGTATLGPNGNVGDKAFNANPASDGMIQPGHYTDDVDMFIPDAALPVTFGSPLQPPPGPGVIGGVVYNYVVGNGDYRFSSLSLALNQRMIVTGDARIHITGATTVRDVASIAIATNATLEWYAGNGVNIGGNGVINVTGFVTNFSLVGLATCPSIIYNGTSRFIGTICAPGSAVSISGTADAMGAVVAGSFTLTGSMGLHFDEDLKRSGPFF